MNLSTIVPRCDMQQQLFVTVHIRTLIASQLETVTLMYAIITQRSCAMYVQWFT